MRKFNIFLMVSLILGFASCDQENIGTLYEGAAADEATVAFSGENLAVELTAENENKFYVTLNRSTTEGTGPTVELALDDATTSAGIFSLTSTSVNFEDGKGSVDVEIAFTSLEDLGAASHVIELSVVDSALLSPTMLNVVTIKAGRKLTFEPYGEGTFTSAYFEQAWDQVIEKAVEGPIYRLKDVFVEGYHYYFEWDGGISISPIGAAEDLGAPVVAIESGYEDASYGMVYLFTDPDPDYTNFNVLTSTFTINSYWGVYLDGDIAGWGWLDDVFEMSTVY